MRSRLAECLPPAGLTAGMEEDAGRAMTVKLPDGSRRAAPGSLTVYSTENDWPQPQVEVAFGFLIVKPPPVIVSTKSTSAPLRYRMLIGSTNSFTPCDSNT